jgi:hypothetical protein
MEGPKQILYSLAWKHLLRKYNGTYAGSQTEITTDLQGVLYLLIIMDRYIVLHTVLTKASHGGLYIANIMYSYGVPHTGFIIDLHGGLYLTNIMER